MKYIFERRVEILLVLTTIFVILFIYHFPYIYASINTPKDMIFLGQYSFFDRFDVNVYASAIRYGQLHHILLPNLYSSIPNKPILIYTIYTLLGFIFRSSNPFSIFFVTSLITGALFVIGSYFTLRNLGLSMKFSIFSCLTICLAGGLGFVHLVFPNIISSDIFYAINFYDAFLKPHEAIALFLYIFSLIEFYKIFIRGEKSDHQNFSLFITTLSLSLAILIYPYLILSYVLITFIFFFFKNHGEVNIHDYFRLGILYIPAGIVLLIMANQLSFNPEFNELLQHITTDIFPTILGYGILIPIVVFQVVYVKKTLFEKYLIFWIIVSLFLALLPFGPGKIFLRGLYFPFVLTAILGLKQFTLDRFKKDRDLHYLTWILFFVFVVGTSMYIFSLLIYSVHIKKSHPIYMDRKDFQMYHYLNANTPSLSSVLAGTYASSDIPAFSHNTVYVGLGFATQKYFIQTNNMNAFYSGKLNELQLNQFLQENRISYILFGPEEKAILLKESGENINSLTQIYPSLRLIYKSGDFEIYTRNSPILNRP